MQNLESLFDPNGHRLYLTADERRAFVEATKRLEPRERTFCAVLHDTGCRISEALQLPIGRIDLQTRAATFETLKKRRSGIYRAVPLPDDTLDLLDVVHGVRLAGKGKRYPNRNAPLWPFSRMTAWRLVSRTMDAAGIEDGPHKCPKGLRHGFGINAILSGVPVTTLKNWMGHSKLETTSIYLNAVGAEEREIAARMWSASA